MTMMEPMDATTATTALLTRQPLLDTLVVLAILVGAALRIWGAVSSCAC